MESFCTSQELDLRHRKTRKYSILFRALCALALLLFAAECLLTRTGNASAMLRLSWVTVTLLGWACIGVYVCLLRPAKLAETHLKGLLNREPDIREGRLSLTGESFQIPKSVRVRIALLYDTGPSPLRLNLDEDWLRFAPPDGTLVRIRTVRKFITGIETLEPASPSSAVSCPAVRGKKILRRIVSLFPPFLLWLMMVLILVGFVFNRITDTAPQYKITVFADAELQDAPALAEKLEQALPSPIRMVKIHPFSYAMFGSGALREADLYIVPASHVEEYREWFAPLPAELADRAAPDLPDAILVYDPSAGFSVAGEYILYASAVSPEPFYLFFGASSPHLTESDRTAVDAALLLLRYSSSPSS